jgi:hypothetical protein
LFRAKRFLYASHLQLGFLSMRYFEGMGTNSDL